MKTQNGFRIYDRDEIAEDLKDLSAKDLRFPFGIKQVEAKGTKYWVAATKEDVLQWESERLGKKITAIPGNCSMNMKGECKGICDNPIAFCAKIIGPGGAYCICQLP